MMGLKYLLLAVMVNILFFQDGIMGVPDDRELNTIKNTNSKQNVLVATNEITKPVKVTPKKSEIPLQSKSKHKFQTKSYIIPTLLVMDNSMQKFYGTKLPQHIWNSIYLVNKIFELPSFGGPIHIAISEPIYENIDTFTKIRYPNGVDDKDLHDNFCKWQEKKRAENAYDDFTIALFLTRENFCSKVNGKEKCEKVGLSDVGAICDNTCRACAIVQDLDLQYTAATIAHEIGHLLGMHHDNDPRCHHFNEPSNPSSLMDPVSSGKNLFLSKCSRHYLQNSRISGSDHCLTDYETAFNRTSDFKKYLIDENTTRIKQCRTVFSPNKADTSNDECGLIYCKFPGSEMYYPLNSFVAGQGLCARDAKCLEKDCKESQKLKAIDGGWGNWSFYGPCSRKCGVGIKRSYRECNNPKPQNGGIPCKGNSLMIAPCKIRDCPDGHVSPREEQCAAKRNNNFGLFGVPEKVEWQAHYDPRTKPCQLVCRVKKNSQSYAFNEIEVDGTKCREGSSDICIAGRCMTFGCDNELDSKAKFDVCRVCNGDNSTCDKVSGSKDLNGFAGKRFGYYDIVKIPAGAHSVKIELEEDNGGLDKKNYLALKIGGRNILDGKHQEKYASFTLKEPGLPMEYDNHRLQIESLRCSRPIKVDLVVQLNFNNKRNNFYIDYEFVVPKKYQWVITGPQKSLKCKDLNTNLYVADEKCSALRKPSQPTPKQMSFLYPSLIL